MFFSRGTAGTSNALTVGGHFLFLLVGQLLLFLIFPKHNLELYFLITYSFLLCLSKGGFFKRLAVEQFPESRTYVYIPLQYFPTSRVYVSNVMYLMYSAKYFGSWSHSYCVRWCSHLQVKTCKVSQHVGRLMEILSTTL